MNLNLRATSAQTYDAIVIGSGISGGWAAKELTQKGLRTLLLERGPQLEHITDYKTATNNPWDAPHRGRTTPADIDRQPIQSKNYTYNEETKHLWVDDVDNPYGQPKPFVWQRGYHLGGRSLMWGRQTYRLSDLDFEANARDGYGVDWPIRYKDLAPWYDYVETFAGISGSAEGLAQLPDGQFLPPIDMVCLEKHLKTAVESRWTDRRVIHGRTANLSQVKQIHAQLGRQGCQYRNRCAWGCPYGGYFSTQSATLPAARATGRLTLRADAIVQEIIYDERKKRATGVRVLDANTGQTTDYFARIIFLNASTLGTTAVLLNSTSSRFPNGLGNDSGVIGQNLMDHHYGIWAFGRTDEFRDQYYYGRRPTGIYIPRFRNLSGQPPRTDYLRGFAYQGGASRSDWQRGLGEDDFGIAFKQRLTEPGPWSIILGAWGEHLPNPANRATLNRQRTDKWGMPTLDITCEFGENERAMRRDMLASALEMLDSAHLRDVAGSDGLADVPPGSATHEMGTCRMGRDPKTSALNALNQLHAVPNVFITDGSCMTSSACQNPSLTYMALTARAADYAFKAMKRGDL